MKRNSFLHYGFLCLLVLQVRCVTAWSQEKSTASVKKQLTTSKSRLIKKDPSLSTRAKNSAATSFGSSIGRMAGKDAYQNAKEAIVNVLSKSSQATSNDKKKKSGN